MKICTKCKKEKQEDDFGKNKGVKDGLQSWCKECTNEQQRQWRKENPKEYRKRNDSWDDENQDKVKESKRQWIGKHRFHKALYTSRYVAKKYDYFSCDATPEELEAAFTGQCHVCGISEEDHGKRLCIDHAHDIKANNFRGWLCNTCNMKDMLAVA